MPRPVLPATDPVNKVARPPLPTLTPPLPEKLMSPPVAVPALVALPALITSALAVVLLVLMLWATDTLPSADKLIVPAETAMALLIVKSLPAPVIVADTLPVPEMVFETTVSADRTKFKLALLLNVTELVPNEPVVPPLPTCKLLAVTKVDPANALLLPVSVRVPEPA